MARVAATRLLVNNRDGRKAGIFVEKWQEIPDDLLQYIDVDDPRRVLPEESDPHADYDDSTIATVLAWVGEDPKRARYALDQEMKRDPTRAGVVSALTADEPDPDEG